MLDASGIRSEAQACHSALGRLSRPVIEVTQHIVSSSRVLTHLFEQELLNHIRWVKDKLRTIAANRATQLDTAASEPVSEDDLATLAREQNRHSLVSHLGEVLDQGMKRHEFWAEADRVYPPREWQAYALPSSKDAARFETVLRQKTLLLFAGEEPIPLSDADSIVNSLHRNGLEVLADRTIHIPTRAFRVALWPEVARALKREPWHCYRHFLGSVGLSTVANARDLIDRLVQEFLTINHAGQSSISIPADFGEHVVVSVGNLKRSPVPDYTIRGYLRNWMMLYEEKCSIEARETLENKGVRLSKDDYNKRPSYYDEDDVLRAVDGQTSVMAEFLQGGVIQLW